ncbi:ferredoxin reductase-like protein [Violaceomyces palustris]|uniref:Ferredoxin reductase-like protein n=1 Tax=Violaceomyces palustris TaxID=1673888 RepID=A0ACD0NWX8_9BASI|nr:ferredoxin reductase-like protein [Violaceomyces palustris]
MVPEQIALVASVLLTFVSCIAFTKFLAILTGNSLLYHFDQATDFMDLNVILAFVVGLALSIGALFYFDGSKPKPVLKPTEWQWFTLTQKTQLSPNTALYRFKLPKPNSILGLPIGQHISIQAEINGKNVMRSYTPTSSDDDLGFFDLLIKSYEQGNISKYVGQMKIGDKIQVRGPKGQMKYENGLVSRLGMIAGGTGLTPCLQIIRAALKDPKDKTKIDLIYANVNHEDILLKDELDQLAEKHPDQFRIHYFLNNPPQGWTGGSGFVSKEAIEKYLPKSADDIKILMCGPPPMITAMKKHLSELGYPAPRPVSKLPDQVFCF